MINLNFSTHHTTADLCHHLNFLNYEHVPTNLRFTFNSKIQDIFLTHQQWKYVSEGTHGYIFKVIKTRTGEKRAVKISKTGYKENLIKEFLVCKSVKQSSHIIKSFDFFQSKRHSFYTLELGRCDLRVILDSNREGLDYVTTLKIMLGVVKGVAAMHTAGMVHGDIKPENILISYDNLPKIADCSSAQYVNKEGFFTVFGGAKIQTSWYRAPERAFLITLHCRAPKCGLEKLGEMFHRVKTMGYLNPGKQEGYYLCHKKIDVWSLGCNLYELVTGKVLVRAQDDECLGKLLSIWALFEKKDSILAGELDEKKNILDSIMKQCLDFNVYQRITISNLKNVLVKELKANKRETVLNYRIDQLMRLIKEATGISLSSSTTRAIVTYLPSSY